MLWNEVSRLKNIVWERKIRYKDETKLVSAKYLNTEFSEARRSPTEYAAHKVALCIGCTPVPIKFLTVSAAELWHSSSIACRVIEKRDKSPQTSDYYLTTFHIAGHPWIRTGLTSYSLTISASKWS